MWVQVATRPHKQSNKSNLGSQSEIYTFFTQPWDWRCQKCRSKVWVNWLGTSQNAIYQNQIKCVTFLHSVTVQSLFWTFLARALWDSVKQSSTIKTNPSHFAKHVRKHSWHVFVNRSYESFLLECSEIYVYWNIVLYLNLN